jgi:hypothetical protein
MDRDSVTFKILLWWARHVACMGEKSTCRVWWRNMKNSDHLEDLSVDWRLTIKWILKICAGREWIGLIWIRY